MYAVCKIDRGRPCGKILDLTGRGKAIHIVREQIQIVLQQIHEFSVVRHVSLPFQNLAKPYQLLLLLDFDLLAVGGLFIFPVGRDTVLCRLMHIEGTDLYFKRLAGASDQSRMQGLIHICLRHGNIVLEAAGNGLVIRVDHTQCSITVLHGIDNDSNREQIIDLIQRLILVLHLLVNAEEMLDSSVDLGLDAGISDVSVHLFDNASDVFLTGALSHGNLVHQIIVHFRLQIFQRKVIQFDLQLTDTQSLCNGTVNLERLPCDPLLAGSGLILQGTHVMQTVCQLDHDDTDILRHGEEHLTQVFGLHLKLLIRLIAVFRGQRYTLQLGDAVYQKGDILSEFPL